MHIHTYIFCREFSSIFVIVLTPVQVLIESEMVSQANSIQTVLINPFYFCIKIYNNFTSIRDNLY